MSARQKLNGVVLAGAGLMAAVVWAVTGSGGLAVIVAVSLIHASLGNGMYRPDPPPSAPRRRGRR